MILDVAIKIFVYWEQRGIGSDFWQLPPVSASVLPHSHILPRAVALGTW